MTPRKLVSEVDAGISFTIPWVNPGKYSAGVREARANLAAVQQGLDREQKEALRLLRDQLAKVETFHHHVELFRDKIVPQAEQAFEATRLSYESGKATFLDWISAQRNLRDIQAMGRDHLAHYQAAVAELEAVIGADIYSPLPASGKGDQMTMKLILRKTALLTALVALLFGAMSCSRKSATEKPANVDYYTCTMHPSVHANEPGKCPICDMDLVPVMKKSAGEAQQQASSPQGGGDMKDMAGMQGMAGMHAGHGTHGMQPAKAPQGAQTHEFVVPVERQQQIGVTYAKVERKPLAHTIRSVGMIVPDKARNWQFVSRVDGYVQKLDCDFARRARRKRCAAVVHLQP